MSGVQLRRKLATSSVRYSGGAKVRDGAMARFVSRDEHEVLLTAGGITWGDGLVPRGRRRVSGTVEGSSFTSGKCFFDKTLNIERLTSNCISYMTSTHLYLWGILLGHAPPHCL